MYEGQIQGTAQANYNTERADIPAPQTEPDRAYNISIQQMNYGYVITVGCKTFAFESLDKMLSHLRAYLTDVPGVTKAFFDKTLKFNP